MFGVGDRTRYPPGALNLSFSLSPPFSFSGNTLHATNHLFLTCTLYHGFPPSSPSPPSQTTTTPSIAQKNPPSTNHAFINFPFQINHAQVPVTQSRREIIKVGHIQLRKRLSAWGRLLGERGDEGGRGERILMHMPICRRRRDSCLEDG